MVAAELDGVDAPRLVSRALTEQQLVANATGPETLRLLPPLIVTEAHIDNAVARLRTVSPSRPETTSPESIAPQMTDNATPSRSSPPPTSQSPTRSRGLPLYRGGLDTASCSVDPG